MGAFSLENKKYRGITYKKAEGLLPRLKLLFLYLLSQHNFRYLITLALDIKPAFRIFHSHTLQVVVLN